MWIYKVGNNANIANGVFVKTPIAFAFTEVLFQELQ